MHETASGHRGVSRRDVLHGGVASFFAMLAPATVLAAVERAANDARTPLVERLCDLVIPPTDTPGAAAAGAGAFVLLAIDHGVAGLDGSMLSRISDALDAAAGGPFLQAAATRQEAVLTDLDSRAFSSQQPAAGSPELAWRTLKPAIVAGYYTSEAGASRELVYEPVPDSERSNFKLSPDFRARSNEGFGGSL